MLNLICADLISQIVQAHGACSCQANYVQDHFNSLVKQGVSKQAVFIIRALFTNQLN